MLHWCIYKGLSTISSIVDVLFLDLFGFRAKSIRYKIKSNNATEGPEILRPPEEEQGLKDQENHLSKEEWWRVFEKVIIGGKTTGVFRYYGNDSIDDMKCMYLFCYRLAMECIVLVRTRRCCID